MLLLDRLIEEACSLIPVWYWYRYLVLRSTWYRSHFGLLLLDIVSMPNAAHNKMTRIEKTVDILTFFDHF